MPAHAAISAMVRAQPTHRPEGWSIVHTLTQGDTKPLIQPHQSSRLAPNLEAPPRDGNVDHRILFAALVRPKLRQRAVPRAENEEI